MPFDPNIPEGCPLPVPGQLLVEAINMNITEGGIFIPESAAAPKRYRFVLLAGANPYGLSPGDDIYASTGFTVEMSDHDKRKMVDPAGEPVQRDFFLVALDKVLGHYKRSEKPSYPPIRVLAAGDPVEQTSTLGSN